MLELDTNKDGLVKLDEFDKYCRSQYLTGVAKDKIVKLFKFFDANNDGTLSIQELSTVIDEANLVF